MSYGAPLQLGLTQRAHRWRPTPGPPPVIPRPESRPAHAASSKDCIARDLDGPDTVFVHWDPTVEGWGVTSAPRQGSPPCRGGNGTPTPIWGETINWGGGGQVWRRSPLLFAPGMHLFNCTQFVDTSEHETLAYCVMRCTVHTIVESRACTKHSHAV